MLKNGQTYFKNLVVFTTFPLDSCQTCDIPGYDNCSKTRTYITYITYITRTYITHSLPMFSFYTPWKHQKTLGFPVFSGGTKWEHWSEMG